jgi:AmmeMemoRadiSam system protein B
MTASTSIRRAAVAGLFYPGDPTALARAVDALLAAAHSGAADASVRALVSPHAGYAYSGAVAARAFARLADGAFDTVVLIGPSHVDAFDFASVFEGDAYQTPLGLVEVDAALARRLAAGGTAVRLSRRGHVAPARARGEHGLEVLLPFLQRVCAQRGTPRIVPIVMGSQEWDACTALGRAVHETCDAERTLVAASTDLSHFYSYEEAVRLDAVFCDELATLDAARLFDAVRVRRCEACGAGPVIATVLATAAWAERRCQILSRSNSGDVTGEHESVVGYASAVVTSPPAGRAP